MISQRQVRKYGRPLAHLACALPLVVLLLRIEGIGGLNLGENPSTEIRVFLGLWGLRLLLLTLAMSPLRWITGKPWPLQFRRLLGLWSFTYIFIHFVTYFRLAESRKLSFLADVEARPFIVIGLAAFVLMIPLALTSTSISQQKLGIRWMKLHRMVYAIAVLGCGHFLWQAPSDIYESLAYCAIAVLLLGSRFWKSKQRQRLVEAGTTD